MSATLCVCVIYLPTRTPCCEKTRAVRTSSRTASRKTDHVPARVASAYSECRPLREPVESCTRRVQQKSRSRRTTRFPAVKSETHYSVRVCSRAVPADRNYCPLNFSCTSRAARVNPDFMISLPPQICSPVFQRRVTSGRHE